MRMAPPRPTPSRGCVTPRSPLKGREPIGETPVHFQQGTCTTCLPSLMVVDEIGPQSKTRRTSLWSAAALPPLCRWGEWRESAVYEPVWACRPRCRAVWQPTQHAITECPCAADWPKGFAMKCKMCGRELASERTYCGFCEQME